MKNIRKRKLKSFNLFNIWIVNFPPKYIFTTYIEFVMSITSSPRGFFMVQVNFQEFMRIAGKMTLKGFLSLYCCTNNRQVVQYINIKQVSSEFKILQKMSFFTCYCWVKFKFESFWFKSFDKFHVWFKIEEYLTLNVKRKKSFFQMRLR